MVEALREDIKRFKKENGCDRAVVVWAASTEIFVPYEERIHGTLEALEKAMKADDREHIAPSMCYAYAALMEQAPFVMGAPNTTIDIPAMWQLAEKTRMPIAGKDFKTGQTLVKSGFAPIIGTRCLGLSGWLPTFWVLEMHRCTTTRHTTVPKRCANGRHLKLFYRAKNNLISTESFTIRCALTIIHHAMTIKRAGITLIFLAGWAIRCR